MKRSSIVLGIVVSIGAFVGACDDRSPTSPNRVSRPVHALRGIVTEPVGVPVEGATVTVTDGVHKDKSDRTDSAGHYTLIDVDGTFSVRVEKDGYESVTKQVTVPQESALDVEIRRLAGPNDIRGAWTVTFEPHPSCLVPVEGGARTFQASIVQQGAQLTVTLSGAAFVTPPQLTGTIHDLNVSIALPGECEFYCYYGPTNPPAVIERLASNQFLGIPGQITATVSRSAMSGTLSGEFVLMRNATAPIDLVAWCRHDNHRVTFTR